MGAQPGHLFTLLHVDFFVEKMLRSMGIGMIFDMFLNKSKIILQWTRIYVAHISSSPHDIDSQSSVIIVLNLLKPI